MIPRIIHQTSQQVTPEEQRLANRLRRLMPEWNYKFWDDDDNLALVTGSFPQFATVYKSITRGVVKADLARYMYMHAFGGLYLDTDYKIYRKLSEEELKFHCILPVSRRGPDKFRLGNAVLLSEQGHPFWMSFLESLFSSEDLNSLSEASVEKRTGPEGLTDYYVSNKSLFPDVHLADREIFHPQVKLGLFVRRSPETFGAHLCWGSWRTKSILRRVHAVAVRHISSI